RATKSRYTKTANKRPPAALSAHEFSWRQRQQARPQRRTHRQPSLASTRFAVAATEFSGRASGEPLMRLDTQSLLHLGNQLDRRSECGMTDQFEQEVLLQAHARGRSAHLVDAVHSVGHVADLDGCHSATIALQASA